ncbi:hypothetical protein FRC09_003553 [Ceratobasidium sp. 395]|nr:hypothetical protein FRC09_003553 [Ceratobasidium sp. 395]
MERLSSPAYTRQDEDDNLRIIPLDSSDAEDLINVKINGSDTTLGQDTFALRYELAESNALYDVIYTVLAIARTDSPVQDFHVFRPGSTGSDIWETAAALKLRVELSNTFRLAQALYVSSSIQSDL